MADARIAFVHSLWHKEIVEQGRDAFVAKMADLGVPSERIEIYAVPGAFEIPLHARRLASSGAFSAIVGAGFVVDGGIYRHEFVAEAVVSGLMRVQLDTDVPVLSVVLTPHQFHEHPTHTDFFFEHFAKKGAEAAEACVQTVESLARLTAAAA
jgi:6,7-dimethyl-8-ribityllumazine synthase